MRPPIKADALGLMIEQFFGEPTAVIVIDRQKPPTISRWSGRPLFSMPNMRPDCTRTVGSRHLGGLLIRVPFRDGINHFIGFIGIDFVGPTSRRGIFGKEIIDQINHKQ